MEPEYKPIFQAGWVIIVATLGLILMVLVTTRCDEAHAQYQGNLGPNIQYPQPPINSPVQSIHPK